MFGSFDIQAAALYLMCDSTVRQQATFFAYVVLNYYNCKIRVVLLLKQESNK